MRRWHGFVVWEWSAILALLVWLPLFDRGFVLSRDMIWVPDVELTRPDLWGLGGGLPRGVPSDVVVGLLGAVVPAMTVQRLVLGGAILLAAVGAAGLLKQYPLPARLAAATLYVWNPFVAERLVLGQWQLVVGYAALPWLIGALRHPAGPRWAAATLALAATALGPAAAVAGLVVGAAAAWGRGAVRVVVLAGLLSAPWIASGILGSSIAPTDPAAVRLYDLRPEGSFGRIGSALSLGGVWDTDVVPGSRSGWLVVLLVAVGWAVMLVGLVQLARRDRNLLGALAVPGAIGLALAFASRVAPEQVERLVSDVPAGGLALDGTRYLAMLAPLEAVALGIGLVTVLDLLRAGEQRREESRRHRVRELEVFRPELRMGVAVLVVLLPVLALTDLTDGVDQRLEPVAYPAAWQEARTVVAESDVPGDILVLPFSADRHLPWNDGRAVLDPAGRFFDRVTVTNDLRVAGGTIRGDDPRAAELGSVLAAGSGSKALAAAGIGLVVVETDVPGAAGTSDLVKGLKELPVAAAGMQVYAVEGARAATVAEDDRRVMIGAWGAAGLVVVLAAVSAVRASAARVGDRLSPPRGTTTS